MARQVTTQLMFEGTAEEAMNFYVSIFKNSRAGSVTRYGDAGPGPRGSVMTANFQLEGLDFTALNGGPQFPFTEAVSFVVHCETQQEIDYYWDKLTTGGRPSQCGWLKDKFGLSWQIVPAVLPRLLKDPDPKKSQRVMQALMQMTKLDIARLQEAADRT